MSKSVNVGSKSVDTAKFIEDCFQESSTAMASLLSLSSEFTY